MTQAVEKVPPLIAKELAAEEAAKEVKKNKPKSRLKAVDPETAEPSKPKILVYGKAGVGKTWTSLDFPNPYYIDTEGGADLAHYTAKLKAAGGAYFGIEEGSLDFDAVIGQVEALATEEHSYKTLVIDSISNIFISEIASEQERLKKAREKDEYGRSKKSAVSATRRLLNWLQRIDMTVILIAHEKAAYVDGEQKGVTYDAYEKLEYLLNLVLRITKEGESRKARTQKSRLLNFPEGMSFEWGYNKFAEIYGKNIIEKKSEAIILASPEEIKEFNQLYENIKMEENWLEKCLTKAKAETIEELTSTQLIAMMKIMKGKTHAI